MVWSFFPKALEGMRAVEPRIPAGLLISAESLPRWPRMRELALRTGLQAVSVFFAGINEEIARDCQRSGLALYAWTVDSKREMSRLIESRDRRHLHELSRQSHRLSSLIYWYRAQGRSSVGRAAASKSAGRGFESLRPCQDLPPNLVRPSLRLASDFVRRTVVAPNPPVRIRDIRPCQTSSAVQAPSLLPPRADPPLCGSDLRCRSRASQGIPTGRLPPNC